jgi:hypothetical protein
LENGFFTPFTSILSHAHESDGTQSLPELRLKKSLYAFISMDEKSLASNNLLLLHGLFDKKGPD